MIELLFSVCLIAAPADCRDEHMPAPSLFACQMQGQAQIAVWLQVHPKHTLKGGWACKVVFTEPGRDA